MINEQETVLQTFFKNSYERIPFTGKNAGKHTKTLLHHLDFFFFFRSSDPKASIMEQR